MAFYQEFRYCSVPDPSLLSNGICNGNIGLGMYNTKACAFDGGDCIEFNKKYPGCNAPDAARLGDGVCDGGEFNTVACQFDFGDCDEFNERYPDCEAANPNKVGDGKCDPNPFTGKFMDQLTGECGIDGGDCDSRFPVTGEKVDVIASLYPNCNAGIFEALIGNGRCDGLGLNIEECGWDGGDCVQYNEDYPDCDADWPRNIGNGRCSGKVGGYDTIECKYDGGDCTAFREMYPGCLAPRPDWVGDGICNGGLYAKPECKYDGGDCVNVTLPVDSFPECDAMDTNKIGDGICDGKNDFNNFNSEICGFDGGDCIEFNGMYPGCFPDEPSKVGDGTCDEENNNAACNFDGNDCRPVLFQYGKEVSIADYRADTKIFASVQTAFSILSLFASIIILWIIHRSHEGLSTTTNRLLFGLCLSDSISSFAQSLATLPAPSEYEDVIWNAKGNVRSCEAQGFFIFLGSMAAPLYNCSLCFYHLAILKFNKKDDFIKEKIEPFLHGVPILISLMGGFTILGLKGFNPNMTYCFIGSDPTCDDVECDRIQDSTTLFIIFSAAPYIILPSVIIISMSVMYKFVLQQERKLEKYGVGSFRHNIKSTKATATVDNNIPDKSRSGKESQSGKKALLRGRSCDQKGDGVIIRKRKKQSRIVLNTALSYSLACLFSYSLPVVISIRTLSNLSSGFAISIITRILFPLQGFFNFLVFVYPRLQGVMRRHKNISWFAALSIALKSRGPRKRVSRSLRSEGSARRRSSITVMTSKVWLSFIRRRHSSSNNKSFVGNHGASRNPPVALPLVAFDEASNAVSTKNVVTFKTNDVEQCERILDPETKGKNEVKDGEVSEPDVANPND